MPLLYTYRRCPYAMRARMALRVSNTSYVSHEVSLRDKPSELLRASPKGTVPVLVLDDGAVIDESLDIMLWALHKHDPEQWLAPGDGMFDLIAENDGSFKRNLDRYKYPHRFENADPVQHREQALVYLRALERHLEQNAYLFGSGRSLADIAIVPFVRQFAGHDPSWFASAPLTNVQRWLAELTTSPLFVAIMQK